MASGFTLKALGRFSASFDAAVFMASVSFVLIRPMTLVMALLIWVFSALAKAVVISPTRALAAEETPLVSMQDNAVVWISFCISLPER